MKALVLYSGGLDSMLAMKLLTQQGIEVIALHINIGFGVKEDRYDVLKRRAAIAGVSVPTGRLHFRKPCPGAVSSAPAGE